MHSPATLSVIKMTTNSFGISSYYSSAPFGSAPTTFGAVTSSAASVSIYWYTTKA
jgi:hypothetical protein